MTNSPFFTYCGVHYKSCPVELREAWACIGSYDKLNMILQELYPTLQIEFVIISTCNRYDVCFFVNITKQQINNVFLKLYSDYQNQEKEFLVSSSVTNYLQFLFDLEALRYLFKVTASLNSLVLGEPQILGQVKDAYLKSVELGFAQNLAGPIFNRCFRVAKKVRTETEIGRNGISIGHAAIDIISRVFDNFTDKKILIIGAGEMARITAQHLLFSKAKSVFIANRTFMNAEKLALELGQAWPLELDTALEKIFDYDICITAAGGSHYLIEKKHLKDYSKKRHGKLSVMVDISVPRKIDPNISEIDNLFLFNVDDLDSVMEQNRESRKIAAAHAEKIIENEVQDYIFTEIQKKNLANVGKFHSWVKNVVDYEVNRYLKEINNGKKIAPKVISDAIAKKLVSSPAFLAKNNITIDTETDSIGDVLEFMFKLTEQPLLPANIYKEDNLLKFPLKSKMGEK